MAAARGNAGGRNRENGRSSIRRRDCGATAASKERNRDPGEGPKKNYLAQHVPPLAGLAAGLHRAGIREVAILND
jgi:hypothetical protein